MTCPRDLLDAARRQLESAYGLALEGLSEEQIASAVAGSAGGEAPRDLPDPRMLERIVDRLPIDESWLFRDDALWSWLTREVAPALLERALAAGRPVRVLSVGCSAGQEPFSAAIAFQSVLEGMGIPPSAGATYVSILGVDSSPARIEVARAGVVNGWSVQRARPEWLRGRVRLEDRQSGRHRVEPSVLAMCRFEVGNLVSMAEGGNAAFGGWDLVFCRNVLIYFRASEAERIAGQVALALDAGTTLVLSAAEAHLLGASRGIEPLGYLGAGRAVREVPGAGPFPSPVRRRRDRKGGRGAESRNGAGMGSRAPWPAPRSDAVAVHLRDAIEHAEAGRTVEALREARAALFHDPRQLFSRLLVGRHLIPFDVARAREVLRELVEVASRLPQDAEVPHADGLSVGQLATAARLLLRGPGGE
ncbi:MAG TPA: CheR family methyltransferase [Anaeromyxobacteraceae bacterium]|nr:CheR family methyltransferase [Anaeromyxobacteraceae bacterium]